MMFCGMDHRASWIRERAATSLNASQVETTLVQLNEQWPANAMSLAEVVQQFPLGESALIHLLAVSSICATRLTRNPETLLWLAQPEVRLASRSRARTGRRRTAGGDHRGAFTDRRDLPSSRLRILGR